MAAHFSKIARSGAPPVVTLPTLTTARFSRGLDVGHPPFNLTLGQHRLAGSAIGGIRETQEMLDFCADHGITSDIELIKIQDINQAYERLAKSDVKYRFVIDIASLK